MVYQRPDIGSIDSSQEKLARKSLPPHLACSEYWCHPRMILQMFLVHAAIYPSIDSPLKRKVMIKRGGLIKAQYSINMKPENTREQDE